MTVELDISVIGAGSWGTALADLLARHGNAVRLWAREAEVVEGVNRQHRNPLFLHEAELHPTLTAEADLEAALTGADLIVSAVPTQHLRHVFGGVETDLTSLPPIVSVSKGIDAESLMTPSGVLVDLGAVSDRVVALSGPSFARDVAAGLPTAVVAAGPDAELARWVRDVFSHGLFRVYSSDDRIGAELGGALKNVIAIAAGAVEGLELGDNARAAIITRGLAEVGRLGVALGGAPETFAGLSGVGDLVLTCTGTQSRNHRVGAAIGRGKPPEEVLAGMSEVAEGVKTALPTRRLARSRGVEMPITEQVCAVVHEGRDPRHALGELIGRAPRDEREPQPRPETKP
ncbi:MAG: NAD(P)H-dependent glycerol-3-phosphate dehydrogenase [Actinomycetota bacterium]